MSFEIKFGKISTIKVVRSITNIGLVDAKNLVEKVVDNNVNDDSDQIERKFFHLITICQRIKEGNMIYENGELYWIDNITDQVVYKDGNIYLKKTYDLER